MLGHTQALLGYLAEACRNHIVGSDPFDIESLVHRMKYGDYGRAGEIVMSGIALRRDGVLGHHRQGARPARVPAAGRRGPRPDQGLRQRLVHGRAHARGVPRGGAAGGRARLPRAQVRPVRRGPLRARPRRADALGRAGRGGARRRRARRSRSWSRCTGASPPHEAIRSRGLLEPFKPAWIEEPVPPENLKALAKVAEHTPLPIATGERIHDRTRVPRAVRAAGGGHHPARHRAHRRHPRDAQAGGDGRDALRAGRAAQRRRAGARRRRTCTSRRARRTSRSRSTSTTSPTRR